MKNLKTIIKVLLVILLLLTPPIFSSYKNVYAAPPVPDGSTMSVLIQDLFAAYENNYVAANKKYLNKWIIISGRLKRIEQPLSKPAHNFYVNDFTSPKLVFYGHSDYEVYSVPIPYSLL
jgi:hypothetical protein